MRDTRSPRVPAHPHDPDAAEAAELARALTQVETLYRTGRVPEALAACRPLATRYPREWRVLGLLGLLYAREGNIHQALERLTAALAVSPAHPVEVLTNLALVYTAADAPMHALQTWRSLEGHYTRVMRPPALPDPAGPRNALTAQVNSTPGLEGLPPASREETLLAAERGQLRLLAGAPLPKIEAECRAAIRLAPRYAAPYLTLSHAQFLTGQTAAALATLEARLRVGDAPGELRAALAATHYWLGATVEECRALLAEAEAALPDTASGAQRLAVAEGWGVVGDDAAVLRLLAPLAPADPAAAELPAGVPARGWRLLATAWANTGQTAEALDLLHSLRSHREARVGDWITALEHGATLPGAGERYPYLAWDEVLSVGTFRLFATPTPPARWSLRAWLAAPRRPLGALRDRLLAAYPRLAEVGGLLLWSGDPAVEQLGVRLLKLLGTGEARRILEAHLRGRAGSYGGRQDAGYALLDLGVLPNGLLVPFWTGTDWGEIRLYRLTPGGIYPARQEAEFAAQLAVLEGSRQ
jgi:tetratricopeptide (TPR) repeat protein